MAQLDGGPTVVVEQLAAALAHAGVDVSVATTDSDGAGGKLHVRDVEQRGAVDYHFFARNLPGTWKLSLSLSRWLRANSKHFDVIHVHALFCHSTIAGCRNARRSGVPYVLSPHGAADPWSMERRSWKKAPYFRLFERRHFGSAAAIHATGAAEAAAIDALGFGSRVHVIPLGVELGVGKTHAPSDRPLQLLFLSRLHPKKGIPLLLDSLARARAAGVPVELSIAGEGPPPYKRELQEQIERLKLREIVRFLGQVEGRSKRDAFAAADAFVLPSHQENFGIAVAEAMSSGLPVVITDQVGIAPDVIEAGAGLVVPVDETALVEALSRLARSPRERAEMGARAMTFARSRYSWERAAERFLALYERLVATNVAGAA